MKRTIINIDEEKCTGCGLCIGGCHEGALQLIDGKARLVSALFCDGLGACIGECPEGAITLEEKEAEPYNESLVMERISPKGKATVLAHLRHLRDHGEFAYVKEGIKWLSENKILPEAIREFQDETHGHGGHGGHHGHEGGCPGSSMMQFGRNNESEPETQGDVSSQLTHWPIQLHLLSPVAPYFRDADVVLAADCVAFSFGNFHQRFLKGKSIAIACPKLDSEKERYVEKLKMMIDDARINTLSVLMMEVPCCGGLLQLVNMARTKAGRKIPVKSVIISLKGEILKEEWV